jgi:hypothetical protein
VIRRLAILLGGTVAVWLLAAYPAYRLGGEFALAISAAAAGLCLVPTLLTLAWANWAEEQTPEQQLLMVLGGTGVRIVVVLGAGLILWNVVPDLRVDAHDYTFWIWVLIFYVITLGLEMAILVVGRARPQPAAPKAGISGPQLADKING